MINKVILVGRIGSKPELRYTQSNLAVLNLAIATNKSKKVGETWEQTTHWHDVVTFGKLAESLKDRNLDSGSLIGIEGEIEYSTYKNKDGVQVKRTSIIASHVKVLDSKNSQSGPTQSRSAPSADSQSFDQGPQFGQSGNFDSGSMRITEDDLPF